MIVACLVVARRFVALRRLGWVAYCVATAVAVLALTWWPSVDGISVRLALAVVVAFSWMAGLAAHLLVERSGG